MLKGRRGAEMHGEVPQADNGSIVNWSASGYLSRKPSLETVHHGRGGKK